MCNRDFDRSDDNVVITRLVSREYFAFYVTEHFEKNRRPTLSTLITNALEPIRPGLRKSSSERFLSFGEDVHDEIPGLGKSIVDRSRMVYADAHERRLETDRVERTDRDTHIPISSADGSYNRNSSGEPAKYGAKRMLVDGHLKVSKGD
jgi:hypothetical protein